MACLFLAGPWARDREDWIQYQIAGGLLLIGVALWVLTWLLNRATGSDTSSFDDVEKIEG